MVINHKDTFYKDIQSQGAKYIICIIEAELVGLAHTCSSRVPADGGGHAISVLFFSERGLELMKLSSKTREGWLFMVLHWVGLTDTAFQRLYGLVSEM